MTRRVPPNLGVFLFIVKSLGRTTWETTVHRKSGDTHRRRATRWEPWKREGAYGTLDKAKDRRDAGRKSNSLRHWAIFRQGRDVAT